MASAAINMLMLTDISVLDISQNELSPDRCSYLLRQWIAAALHNFLLLKPLLLPPDPNANLLPIVLLEYTLAVTGANFAIKAADPRTSIWCDHTIDRLSLTLVTNKASNDTMKVVEVGIADMSS
jgi:hypothetical protein